MYILPRFRSSSVCCNTLKSFKLFKIFTYSEGSVGSFTVRTSGNSCLILSWLIGSSSKYTILSSPMFRFLEMVLRFCALSFQLICILAKFSSLKTISGCSLITLIASSKLFLLFIAKITPCCHSDKRYF